MIPGNCFAVPVQGEEEISVDSVYSAALDSALTTWGAEKPDIGEAPFEEVVKACLDSCNLVDTLRLQLYFLLHNYLREFNRYQESLDVFADAVADSQFQDNPCTISFIYQCMAIIYRRMVDNQKVESMLVAASHYLDGCPLEEKIGVLRSLGNIYLTLGKYQESGATFKKAIDLLEEANSDDFKALVICLACLGYVYQVQAQFHESELTYLKAISLCEKHYGYYSTSLIPPLLYQAGLCRHLGHYHKSEEILQRAHKICDSLENPRHALWGMFYQHQGQHYLQVGKYDEAKKYLQASLDIKETAESKDIEGIASIYILLGQAELERGNYQESLLFSNKGFEISETVAGGYQLYQSTVLTSMAKAYLQMGQYEQSIQFIDSALTLCALTRGTDCPRYGNSLVVKGEILYASGQYDKAKKYILEGLALFRKHYDPFHQRLGNALKCLARACCSAGKMTEGHGYYRESLARRLNFIEYAFSFSSDEQKLRWVNNHPVIDNSLISLAVTSDNQPIIRDACEMVLKGKGIVIDALATQHETAYCSYDSTIISLVNRHQETNETIAALASVGKYNGMDIYRKDTIEVLYRAKDSLENELSRQCSQFSDLLATLRFDLQDIMATLGPEEILLEFIRYTPYDFNGIGNSLMRTGPPHYAAFVIPGQGEIKILDMGPAGEVDSLILTALDMIHATGVEVYTPTGALLERQLNQVTGRLYDIMLAPVNEFLSGRETIFISPDGVLNLLPFEILPDSDSTYIIERVQFHYLSSGRDLIRQSSSTEPLQPYALIIADPELNTAPAADDRSYQISDSDEGSPSNTRSDDCLSGNINPLPYTRYEANEIAEYFQASQKLKTVCLFGLEASEQALKDMAAPPLVLHLATHALFCGKSGLEDQVWYSNPMLRSGFILAGANAHALPSDSSGGIGEDGILYALEIATLDLHNTELAVLSACETGSGDIQDGEGVFGLRRAFQQAGVQSIVMSLWTVPDRETSSLMAGFYKRWLNGISKSEALRQSSLEILRRQRLQRGNGHPYYWGGFILVGNSN